MQIIHKNFLANELEKWRKQGLISDDTSHKIAAQYNIDLGADRSNNFILQLVAYFFFGCALFVLVGANWQEIPRDLRALLLIALTAIVGFGAFYNLAKGNDRYASALLFLSTLIYGASIALIAQIYHLEKNPANGVLLWAVGGFATAMIARKPHAMALSLAIAIGYGLMHYSQTYFVPHLMILFLLGGIYVMQVQSSKFLAIAIIAAAFVYIFVPTFDIFGSFYDYGSLYYTIFAMLGFGLCFIALKEPLLRIGKVQMGENFYSVSLILTIGLLIFLFCVSSGSFNDMISQMEGGKGELLSLAFNSFYGILFLVFSGFCIGVSVIYRNKILLALSLMLLALPFFMILTGLSFELVLSVVCVCVGAALIKTDRLVLGMVVIFIVAFVRYIDLLGDYIGASALFLVFAIIMLVVIRARRVK